MSVMKNPLFQVMKMAVKKMQVKKMQVKKKEVKKNPPVFFTADLVNTPFAFCL